MKTTLPPDWPEDIAAARDLQERTRRQVVREETPLTLRRIAGVDIHVAERHGLTWAAVAVLDGESMELIESVLAARPTSFPYVPGYLSFREIPAALAALAMLRTPPDLLMVDGHGIAHPRRLGIAAHLGVLVDLPTIGVAKSRLVGRHDEPAQMRGSWTPLTHRRELIGAVLRSKDRVRPLFVSIGHRVGLDQAVRLVLAAGRGYRLPEPTRLADLISRMHPA